MGSKFMTAEQSTFMIDLQQLGMMLRYVKRSRYFYLNPWESLSFILLSFFHVL